MIYIIFISTLLISGGYAGSFNIFNSCSYSSMLISILLESRLALLANLCLTILTGIITGNNITFIAMALVGGTVGAFSVMNTQQRANIFVSGLAISIVNIITIVGIGFINSNEVMETFTFGFYGLLNGLFCSVLTAGSLPAWESIFNIVTPLKLLDYQIRISMY